MVPIVVVMSLILGVAVLVALYVAYPHRGHRLPAAPWLGDAMARAAGAAPLIEEEDESVFGLTSDHEESERRH